MRDRTVQVRHIAMRYPNVENAIYHAASLHRGQERDGDDPLPYITHPLQVLENLRTFGEETNEDMLVAAVLHDTVEHATMNIESIAKGYGATVAELVKELTRCEPSAEATDGLDKDEVWELRASMLLDEIRQMSAQAQKIKLADRLANVRDAKRTKHGRKLKRYISHTKRILEIVPRAVSPRLWDAVKAELS